MSKPVCAVVGVGPGNGAAFARKFSDEGYRVALMARSSITTGDLAEELPDARAYECDVTDPAHIEGAFGAAAEELGPIDTVIYNAGSGVFGNFLENSPEDFESAWRINAMGLFIAARKVAPPMIDAGRGNIIVTGATASLRGGARFAAFASAKAAQRNLAESMARELGPKGIHVALLVVDGVVDTPRSRSMMKDASDDAFMQPSHIAAAAWSLVQQPRSAWTFLMELRPFGEKW